MFASIFTYLHPLGSIGPWCLYRNKLWATLNVPMKLPLEHRVYGHIMSVSFNRSEFLDALSGFYHVKIKPNKDWNDSLYSDIAKLLTIDAATVPGVVMVCAFWGLLGQLLSEIIVQDLFGTSCSRISAGKLHQERMAKTTLTSCLDDILATKPQDSAPQTRLLKGINISHVFWMKINEP